MQKCVDIVVVLSNIKAIEQPSNRQQQQQQEAENKRHRY